MKLAILGPGHIADTVTPALVALPEIECYAVASRNLERAKAFAAKYGFQKAYGSYEEMLSDPEVQLVYITTPHSLHYEQLLLCLEYGKNVICEKAFTVNADQAKQVYAKAKEKGLYAAEAIWTRYMPSRKMIQDIIDSGVIGKLNVVTANLSYKIDWKDRLVDPNLAGGTLLDVGIYGLNFALMHFGNEIERMESSVWMTPSGVDGMESITLFYRDGRMAVLNHSMYARSDRKGIFHADKGYVVVENINNPNAINVYDDNDQLLAHYDVPEQINGYEYEFMEAVRCIEAGKTESDSMPASESIYVMELMDALRKQWGLVYPMEK